MANKQTTYEFANLALAPDSGIGKLNDFVCVVDENTRSDSFKIPESVPAYDKVYLSSPRIVRGNIIDENTGLVITPVTIDTKDFYTSDQVDTLLDQVTGAINDVNIDNRLQDTTISGIDARLTVVEKTVSEAQSSNVGVTIIAKDEESEES